MDKIKEPYGEQYYEEHKVILLRSGMDPQDDGAMDQQICSTHRSILGKEFLRAINRNLCHHVKHLGPRSNKASRMITYDEAVWFLKCTQRNSKEHSCATGICTYLKLPFGLPLCNLCYGSFIGAMDTDMMDSEPSKESEKNESSSEASTKTPVDRRMLDFFKIMIAHLVVALHTQSHAK